MADEQNSPVIYRNEQTPKFHRDLRAGLLDLKTSLIETESKVNIELFKARAEGAEEQRKRDLKDYTAASIIVGAAVIFFLCGLMNIFFNTLAWVVVAGAVIFGICLVVVATITYKNFEQFSKILKK